MSRAYRITVRESDTRSLKAGDEIGTTLEILEILSPEDMAGLLRQELANHGFEDQDDGTMARRDGDLTITVDPCSGEVTVKSEAAENVKLETKRDATAFNDVGPTEANLRERVREELKQDLNKKFEREQEKLQKQATEQLEKHLHDLQPEISQIVNKVTREALKQKAAQMGDIKEISEDEETGSLTIKVEV